MKSWLFLIREMFCMRSIHPFWLQSLVLYHYDTIKQFYETTHELVEANHIVEATLSYGKTYQSNEKDSIVITLHYDRFIENNIKPNFPDAKGKAATIVILPSQLGIYEFFKPQLDDMLQFPMPVTAEFDFGFDLRYQHLNMAEMLKRYRVECSHNNTNYQPMKLLLEDIIDQYHNLKGQVSLECLKKTPTTIGVCREGERTFSVALTCFPDAADDIRIGNKQTDFNQLSEIDMWIGVPNTALSLMSGIPFAAHLDFTGWHGPKYGAMLGVNVQEFVEKLK